MDIRPLHLILREIVFDQERACKACIKYTPTKAVFAGMSKLALKNGVMLNKMLLIAIKASWIGQ